MDYAVRVLVLLVVTSFLTACSETTEQGTDPIKAAAKLVLEAGFDFGGVNVNTEATHTVTVTNKGKAAATGIALSGLSGKFSLASTCGETLAVDETCTVTVTFRTTTVGEETATLTASYEAGAGISLTASVLLKAKGLSVPASPSLSSMSANSQTLIAGGGQATAFVALKDESGLPLSGKLVNLTSSRGADDTISPSSATTDENGVATFTVSSSKMGTATFSATSADDRLALNQTMTMTFEAGPMSTTMSTVSTTPPSVEANGTAASTVTVTLLDAVGNPLVGKTVTLSPSRPSGLDVVSAASGPSSATGVVTFTVTSVKATAIGTPALFTARNTTDNVAVSVQAAINFTPGAVSTALSTLVAAPKSVASDGQSPSTLTLSVVDAKGNPIPNLDTTVVSSRPTEDQLTAMNAKTNGSGVATYSTKSSTAGDFVYSSPQVAKTETVTFNVGAVSAANSTVAATPAKLPADGTTKALYTVVVKDVNKNAVAGRVITLRQTANQNPARAAGADSISAASGPSNAKGEVTFNVTSTKAGAASFTAADTDAKLDFTAKSVTFDPGAVNATHSTVSPNPSKLTADNSAESVVTVKLLDVYDNPVPGKVVSVARDAAQVPARAVGLDTITAVTAASTSTATGEVVFKVKSGTVGVAKFLVKDVTDANLALAPFEVTYTAGGVVDGKSKVDATPAKVSADGISKTVVTVTLLDKTDNGVPDREVRIASSRNDATTTRDVLEPSMAKTDANGVATFTAKSAVVGTSKYTAKYDAATALTAFDEVEYTLGAVSSSKSMAKSDPSTIAADGSKTSKITVSLRDAGGNAVVGKTVTLVPVDKQTPARTTTTDIISKASGASNSAGEVTFTVSSKLASKMDDPALFRATDTTDGITVDQLAKVAFTAGVANKTNSTISATPANVVANNTATSKILVTAMDLNKNPVPQVEVVLSVDKARAAGADTIMPSNKVMTNASGIAEFNVKSNVTGPATFSATAGGVALQGTALVTYDPGLVDAKRSTVTVNDTTLVANGTATTKLNVVLRDASDNVIKGKVVSALVDAKRPANADKIDPATVTSSNTGLAVFTLSSTKIGDAIFTAKADGVTLSVTPKVTYTAGPVTLANSTVVTTPSSVLADGKAPATVTITLLDAKSNPVKGKNVVLSAVTSTARPAGTDMVDGSPAVSDDNGVAKLSVRSAKAGTDVNFTAKGDNIALTNAKVTFNAGITNADNSLLAITPTTVVADGVSLATAKVTLLDAGKNPVAKAAVTLMPNPDRNGKDTISTPNPVTTDASGVAQFTIKSTKSTVAGAPAASFTAKADGVTLTKSGTITFSPGLVNTASSTVTASKNELVADDTETATIKATLLDVNGNPVSGKSVTLSMLPVGSSKINAPNPAMSGANGEVSFVVHSATAGESKYTATATDTKALVLAAQPTVKFNPGVFSPAKSTISIAPLIIASDGESRATATVTARDANNNLLTKRALSPMGSRGPLTDTITPFPTTTNDKGVAVFYVRSSNETAKDAPVNISVSENGITLAAAANQALTFTKSAPSATASTIKAVPDKVLADGVTKATVSVNILNQNLGGISGKNVVLTSSRGALDTISKASGASTSAGLVTFTVTSSKSGPATFTAYDSTDDMNVKNPATVTFTAGAFSKSVSTVNPDVATAPANGKAKATVTVLVLDAKGNPVEGAGLIALRSSRAAGTDTISAPVPASAKSDADGRVVFEVTSSKIGKATFTAKNGATDIVDTADVTFTVGAISRSRSQAKASPPIGVVADNAKTSTVTVTVRDDQDNPVADAVVSVKGDRAGADTVAPATVKSNAAGVATFTAKSTKSNLATYTATAGGLEIDENPTVMFDPGAMNASKSTITVAPPGPITANNVDKATFTVTLRDINQNLIPNRTVSMLLGTGHAAGTDTIYGTSTETTKAATAVTAVTNPTGVATFQAKSSALGPMSYTFKDGTVVIGTGSMSYTAGAVDKAQSKGSANPATNVIANDTATSTITYTIKDASGFPLASQSVRLDGAPHKVVSTNPATTNATGVVTFTVKSTVAGTGSFVPTVVNANNFVLNGVDVGFVAGPMDPNKSTISVSPNAITADGIAKATISILLRDAFLNTLADRSVSVNSSKGPDDVITGTMPAKTDKSGAATWQISSKNASAVAGTGSSLTATSNTPPQAFAGNASIKFFTAGTIITAAGTGTAGFSGDGGAANNAKLSQASGVAVDSKGNLYIADTANHRIRRVTPTNSISTFAGIDKAGAEGDGGQASKAQLNQPTGLTFDKADNLYFADTGNHKIRMIAADGTISTIAGTGKSGFDGDGDKATDALLNQPTGIALDADQSNLYLADTGNHVVRRVTVGEVDKRILHVAGNGVAGLGGDDGKVDAAEVQLSSPTAVVVDSTGNVFIADAGNHRIRKVSSPDFLITTYAGSTMGLFGDNGAATAAKLKGPNGLILDAVGNLYISDAGNFRVRKVTKATSVITTIAGTTTAGKDGDNGPATAATFRGPAGLAKDSDMNLFIADPPSSNVRKIFKGL